MKIMTFGNGFVANHLPYDKITDRILPWQSHIKLTLEYHKPDVIINCIGKTGRPNIDWCETNQSETYLANVILPGMIAAAANELGIHMIHIGSGCIYFGESPNIHYVQADGSPMPEIKTYSLGDSNYQPFWGQCFKIMYPTKLIDEGWKETDFANPQSFYSKTKYACDLMLGQMSNLAILRIRMPISPKNEPRNFINKVRGYQRIIDIPNSMTFMDDLVRCIDWVIKERKTGIYHVVNPEPLTAAQIMREYQKHNANHNFDIITEKELDALTVAKRSNCILNSNKLNKEGFFMTPSEEALKYCMEKYVE